MKILVSAVTLLVSLSSFAQETHSPQYECQTSEQPEAKMYVMIGNKFHPSPDIPELGLSSDMQSDYSYEVYFTPKENYASGTYKDSTLYKIESSDSASLIAVDPSDKTQYLLLSNETSLFVYNSEGVTEYSCIPLRYGRRSQD